MKRLVCLMGAMLCFGSSLRAADPDLRTLQDENAQLRERLNRVESELAQIKALLGNRAAAPATTKKPITSALDVELYGYVKLDAAYDDSRTSVGNYARWVESEAVRRNDNQFSMTANQTRLGLRLKGPEMPQVKTTGQLEIDFYGAGVAENKPEPMLRHAYVSALWPEYHFSLLAGQTSDIISPLFMPTLNYTAGWWQGNIGYRRPQVRLTKELALAPSSTVKLELAGTRTITDRKFFFTASTDPASGDDAGFPTFQGRLGLTLPAGSGKPASVGVSGHWGREERHETKTAGDSPLDTWSINLDAKWPVTKWLTVQGEAFVGQNLDAYLGGIGQGFVTNNLQAVHARGGWVAATIEPAAQWQFSVGAGCDVAYKADLIAGMRNFNAVGFGNVQYFITPNLSLGLEVSYLHTDYKNQADGDNWREQFSVIYKF
jgi:hypothetical protein